MADHRNLSPEGVAILEALIEGAVGPSLSDSVLYSLELTGLVQKKGEGWMLTEEGLRSLEAARERMKDGPQISRGIG